MKLRLLGLMFLLGASLLLGGRNVPVLAQSGNETAPAAVNFSYANVKVWVNPEYDDPRLLVMMQGQLVGATPPVRVKFLVPSGAVMYSAGSKDAQDVYIPPAGGVPFRNASSVPGWDEISYDLQTSIFRVEYYDQAAIVGSPNKTISYDFRTLYPISNLNVILQQPKNSTGFTVDPKGAQWVDQEGFTTFTSSQNSLAAGGVLHWNIAYTRTDTNPAFKPPTPSSQPPAGTSPISSTTGLIIAIVIAVVLIGGATIWILKSRTPAQPKMLRSERRRSARQDDAGQSKQTGGEKKGRFCTKCGAPAGTSAKFCPSCGAKLREQG